MPDQDITADIRLAFERIEQEAARRESAFERRALRNYLLHTLLAATGRLDELFEYDTATREPDYVFYNTGKRVDGRAAIVAFHRERAAEGASLCVPMDQRVAMGAWGFAAEQTMHQFLADGRLQRTHSALVWRCDEKGRLKNLHFYPAVKQEEVRHPAPLLDSAALADALSPLIERLKKMQ